MTFVDEEEAYKAYNAYSFTKGFGIRKGGIYTYTLRREFGQSEHSRWTKSARQKVHNDDSGPCSLDLTTSRTYHLKELMRQCFDVMSLSIHDIKTVKIAKKRLQELDVEIRNYASSFCKSDNHTMRTEDNDVPQHSLTRILDPLKRMSKGVTNSRMKSSIEKRKKGKSLKGKKPLQQFHDINPINQPPMWNTNSHMNPSHQYMGTPSYMTPIQPGYAQSISFTSLLNQDYQSVASIPQNMFPSDSPQ
ncbi:protein FAR1-RELATED SEQUENCE 5-like [Salvia divinorum]|uniref:Protein FAR1-RELATED SEQUENCE 5-like n=1 Tax=Salvia divinorum TaxID=28513 RepID=A0ABD1HEW0_SALDI